ncbi:hypothetical protein [Vibrio phage CKB-S2]|nr:hypothetical protein [Vibrio phage CKB-S2]
MTGFQYGVLIGAAGGVAAFILALVVCRQRIKELHTHFADLIDENNNLAELRIRHAQSNSLAQGLARARMMVIYIKRRYDKDRIGTPEQRACNEIIEKIGVALNSAEMQLQFDHDQLEELNKK